MYIKGIYTKGTQRRYFICEKDGARDNDIAWFDTFEEAGIVLRYLKGSNMREEDQEEAIYLMRDFDLHMSKNQNGEAEQTTDTPRLSVQNHEKIVYPPPVQFVLFSFLGTPQN